MISPDQIFYEDVKEDLDIDTMLGSDGFGNAIDDIEATNKNVDIDNGDLIDMVSDED